MKRSLVVARLRHSASAFASPRLEPALLAVTTVALVAGGISWLLGAVDVADALWGLGTAAAIVPRWRGSWSRCDRGMRAST